MVQVIFMKTLTSSYKIRLLSFIAQLFGLLAQDLLLLQCHIGMYA